MPEEPQRKSIKYHIKHCPIAGFHNCTIFHFTIKAGPAVAVVQLFYYEVQLRKIWIVEKFPGKYDINIPFENEWRVKPATYFKIRDWILTEHQRILWKRKAKEMGKQMEKERLYSVSRKINRVFAGK